MKDSPERAFEFLEGEWVAHCKCPMDDGTFVEDEGTLRAERALDGSVSIEWFNGLYLGDRVQGLGLRAYNRETKQLEHTWTDTSSPGWFHVWRGTWDGDGIDLFAEWTDASGLRILSRLTWSKITRTTAHWESARSLDGGRTWQLHWLIDFVRS